MENEEQEIKAVLDKHYKEKLRLPEFVILSEELAIQHWSWLNGLLGKVYKDAFMHGFKHGYELRRKDE